MTDARTLDPIASPRPVADAPGTAANETVAKESRKLSADDGAPAERETRRPGKLPFLALRLPIDARTQFWTKVVLLLALAAAIYMAWGFVGHAESVKALLGSELGRLA